jgi:hypothetical protein
MLPPIIELASRLHDSNLPIVEPQWWLQFVFTTLSPEDGPLQREPLASRELTQPAYVQAVATWFRLDRRVDQHNGVLLLLMG